LIATSQLVDVSVQPGGGSRSDPDGGTLGVINWHQTIVSDYGQICTSAAIVCGFRTMAIRIPKRCRSRLRSDADHDSDAMPITNRDRFGMVIDMS